MKVLLLVLFPFSGWRMILWGETLVFGQWEGPYAALGLSVSGLTGMTFLLLPTAQTAGGVELKREFNTLLES